MLQTTATDHCCFKTAQKQAGVDDFRLIPNGTGGIEDRLSVLWTQGVRTGKISRSDFVAITSSNTAKLFNIFPKKGALMAGADADIVIWDPEKTRTISVDTHHQNIDFNIYEGMETTGNAAVTLSRGMVVWEDDTLKTERGRGQYLKRPPFAPFWESQQLRNELAEPTKVEREAPKKA